MAGVTGERDRRTVARILCQRIPFEVECVADTTAGVAQFERNSRVYHDDTQRATAFQMGCDQAEA
jgi:hypothetical protein